MGVRPFYFDYATQVISRESSSTVSDIFRLTEPQMTRLGRYSPKFLVNRCIDKLSMLCGIFLSAAIACAVVMCNGKRILTGGFMIVGSIRATRHLPTNVVWLGELIGQVEDPPNPCDRPQNRPISVLLEFEKRAWRSDFQHEGRNA